jgi:hypothetical protein
MPESDDDPLIVSGLAHPSNPAAVQGVGGVWGEAILPVTEWEIAHRRVVVPADLQLLIGLPVPVLRVSRNVHAKQLTKHADTLAYYERLSEILGEWSFYRQKIDRDGEPVPEWEVIQIVSEGKDEWPLLTALGIDASGSWNLITNHRKNGRFYRRLLEGQTSFQRKLK